MKLTDPQRHVLQRLSQGWDLSFPSTFDGGTPFLGSKGHGRGGRMEKVRTTTVHALVERGLVRFLPGFPVANVELTPEGRRAAPCPECSLAPISEEPREHKPDCSISARRLREQKGVAKPD